MLRQHPHYQRDASDTGMGISAGLERMGWDYEGFGGSSLYTNKVSHPQKPKSSITDIKAQVCMAQGNEKENQVQKVINKQ